MKFDPASNIQDLLQFGEYGDVNPSVTNSATFTFMQANTMLETFEGEAEGCFLYSRHWNPGNKYLADAVVAMEGTEAAWVTASGMGAISNAIMHVCNAGDHIVSSMTTYGGTYALLANYLPKFNIETLFSNSGKSTSSEVPEEIQKEMGMSDGLIRFSVGLDNDIERTFLNIKKCLSEMGLV